jgi:hypothetical protein
LRAARKAPASPLKGPRAATRRGPPPPLDGPPWPRPEAYLAPLAEHGTRRRLQMPHAAAWRCGIICGSLAIGVRQARLLSATLFPWTRLATHFFLGSPPTATRISTGTGRGMTHTPEHNATATRVPSMVKWLHRTAGTDHVPLCTLICKSSSNQCPHSSARPLLLVG